MTELLRQLRAFNRRERFILLREALGGETFTLDAGFRLHLGLVVGEDVPAEAFVALDYPLDWLALALALAASPATSPAVLPNENGALVQGSPLDVDLLVAFAGETVTHVVLLEAKVATAWRNDQLQKKADRLAQLFGADGRAAADVRPHFLLASPRRPRGVRTAGWPAWMAPEGRVAWMELREPRGLRKATRCAEDGRRTAAGRFLRLEAF